MCFLWGNSKATWLAYCATQVVSSRQVQPTNRPAYHLYLTQVQLKRAGLSSALVSPPSYGDGANAAPLVRALLLQIGETLSVWSRPAATAATLDGDPGMTPFCPPRLTSKESLSSAEEAVALAGAHVGLLRALLAKEGWSAPLMDCLREARGCFKCFFRFEGLHKTYGFVAHVGCCRCRAVTTSYVRTSVAPTGPAHFESLAGCTTDGWIDGLVRELMDE